MPITFLDEDVDTESKKSNITFLDEESSVQPVQSSRVPTSTFGLDKAETIGASRKGLIPSDVFPETTKSIQSGSPLEPLKGPLPLINDLFALPGKAAKSFLQVAEDPRRKKDPLSVIGGTLHNLPAVLRGKQTRPQTRERQLITEAGGEALLQAAIPAVVAAIATTESLRGIRNISRGAKAHLMGDSGIFGRKGLLGGGRQELVAEQSIEKELLSRKFKDIEIKLASDRQVAIDAVRSKTAPALKNISKQENVRLIKANREMDALDQSLLETADKQVIKIRDSYKRVASSKSELYREIQDKAVNQAQNKMVPVEEVRTALTESLSHRSEDIGRVMDNLLPGESTGGIRISDIANEAKKYRTRIGVGKRSGRTMYTSGDDLADSISDGLNTVARNNGILGFDEARAVWADWAPLRNDIWRDFKPFLRSDSQIAASTKKLVNLAKSPIPGDKRYVQKIEDILGVPLMPEQSAALEAMDTAQKAQAATNLELELLKEQVKLTESRHIEDVNRLFGIKSADEARELQKLMDTLDSRQHDVLQRFDFKKRLAGGTIGIAAAVLAYQVVNRIIRPIFPDFGFGRDD